MPAPILPADLNPPMSPSPVVRASYSARVRESFTPDELTWLAEHRYDLLTPLVAMGEHDAHELAHYRACAAAGAPVWEPESWEGPAYAVETARSVLDKRGSQPAPAPRKKWPGYDD